MKSLEKFLRSDLGFSVSAVLLWRILITFLGFISLYWFKNPSRLIVEYDFGLFWNMWSEWDGWHYIKIATEGYSLENHNTVFFPLFPSLINFLTSVTKINPIAAGLLISHSSLLLACYFLLKLVKIDFSQNIARKSVIYLLVFPSAVFLGAVYTESLFLALTVSSFYFARTQKWLYVFVLGFLVSLTRNLGVLLTIPLFWEYFQHKGFKFRKEIVSVFAPSLGLASYMAYLWVNFGNPFYFIIHQQFWERSIEINIFANYLRQVGLVFDLFKNHNPWHLIEFIAVNLVLMLIIHSLKNKIRTSYVLWMFLLLIPGIMQNMWTSMNRYVLVIFPLYIAMAVLTKKNKFLHDIILIVSGTLLAYHTALFINFIWAG